MRAIRWILLALCLAAAAWMARIGVDRLDVLLELFHGTPHARYAARLVLTGESDTAAGRAWLEAADRSLDDAVALTPPAQVRLDVQRGSATAVSSALRRGERYRLDVAPAPGDLFVDLFRRTDDGYAHVASQDDGGSGVSVEIRDDGEYVVRLQRRLPSHDPEGGVVPVSRVTVTTRAEPSLMLPVEGATRRSIQSFFGAARDGGRRSHAGVDIFAPRGTPVRAASSGVVASVGTNGLGGKVVWIVRPGHRERHYYAHLHEQLVSTGAFVNAGDPIGTVGNTGNARTTPPHLHFGIYHAGGAVDPLPYIASRDARPSRGRAPTPRATR
jgi:murein DD-endopeptidase MepM/ murein hydrolase activator NlpD